ncbi:MAG: hypothetical protein K6G83_10870 [Lachnospiraceae bacterium]|nr:hypothetical protein [Lachnospiraceae bacterium]
MDENDSMLELLDTLMDIIEKQDEIIYRFGRIVKRQATDLALLRNDAKFSDEELDQDMAVADEVMEDYKDSKKGLEDYFRT